MTPDTVKAALESGWPDAATLRRAVEHAAALAPAITAVAERAAGGAYLLPREQRLLLAGAPVLAVAREPTFRPAWLALLKLPEWSIERLFAKYDVEIIRGVTLALAGDDPAPLAALIEDPETAPAVRWALLPVLARLTVDGRLPRDAVLALLDRFEAAPLAEDDDLAWFGWVDAVVLLGAADRRAALTRVWEKPALRAHGQVDRDDDLECMEATAADPADLEPFEARHVAPFDDIAVVHERLLWFDEDADEGPDDDPAADIRLGRAEIAWLDGFLESEQAPVLAMSMEEVDGFLTALAIGPETVPPPEYMPLLWGTEGDPDASGPDFDSPEQARLVIELIGRHAETIRRRADAHVLHDPIIRRDRDGEHGSAWAEGFLLGLSMRDEAWRPAYEDEEVGSAIDIIAALVPGLPPDDDEADPTAPAAPAPSAEDAEEAAEARKHTLILLPRLIEEIAHFWHARHGHHHSHGHGHGPSRGHHHGHGHHRQEPVRVTKIGRNAPCPCGSGKKYKRCCGARA